MAMMRFVAVGVVVLAGALAGCGTADPTSDAPGLAGSWAVVGQGAADGCWVFDATGDPVSFTPTNDTFGVGVATFNFDGMSQTIDAGGGLMASLVSTGFATQNGDQVTVELNMRVTAIIELAAASISWSATITGNSLTGQAQISGSSIAGPLPTSTEDISGTLDGC